MSVELNGNAFKHAADQAENAAYEQAGFKAPDGATDNTKLREAIFAVLKPAKALNKKERAEKAITRGSLMAQVFPEVVGPEHWGSALEQEVYTRLDRRVWMETQPNANRVLQRMVGVSFGNGYVLCRTRIGQDRVEAAYITDDYTLIEQDFVKVDNERVERALKQAVTNREMLVMRQPHNAKKYVTRYKQFVQGQLSANQNQLQLALAASTATEDEEPEGEDEGGEE